MWVAVHYQPVTVHVHACAGCRNANVSVSAVLTSIAGQDTVNKQCVPAKRPQRMQSRQPKGQAAMVKEQDISCSLYVYKGCRLNSGEGALTLD